MRSPIRLTNLVLIDKILKEYKPKCIFCAREMLPIGPEEYFCNYDACENRNKHILIDISFSYITKEDRNGISKQTQTKETKKTKEIETKEDLRKYLKRSRIKKENA